MCMYVCVCMYVCECVCVCLCVDERNVPFSIRGQSKRKKERKREKNADQAVETNGSSPRL